MPWGILPSVGIRDSMDDENIIESIEDLENDGPIDTTEKLAVVLAGLEPGKIACLFQEELPEFPTDEEDDREYVVCKIMRDNGEPDPPPFFLIGLDVDQAEVAAAAEEIIERALGGKITASGMVQ